MSREWGWMRGGKSGRRSTRGRVRFKTGEAWQSGECGCRSSPRSQWSAGWIAEWQAGRWTGGRWAIIDPAGTGRQSERKAEKIKHIRYRTWIHNSRRRRLTTMVEDRWFQKSNLLKRWVKNVMTRDEANEWRAPPPQHSYTPTHSERDKQWSAGDTRERQNTRNTRITGGRDEARKYRKPKERGVFIPAPRR